MNYTELCTNIENICENEFSAATLAMFTEQAEQKIYNSVQIPAIRKNVTGALSVGVKYLQIPSDFLYVYSLAVIESTGEYHYLIDKDVNFIREARCLSITPSLMPLRLLLAPRLISRTAPSCTTATTPSPSLQQAPRGLALSLIPLF